MSGRVKHAPSHRVVHTTLSDDATGKYHYRGLEQLLKT